MQLREYYETGLTPTAYIDLLDDKQKELHALYQRRLQIDPVSIQRLRATGRSHLLVVTEPWCGDSLAIFPVLSELRQVAEIELRVVRRDAHPELIDRYLTRGGRAIPIAIFLDEAYRERFHWGPRPGPAQALFERHRAVIASGKTTAADLHRRIRAFYARDRGRTIVAELLDRFAASTTG